jgi:hypothetical protein
MYRQEEARAQKKRPLRSRHGQSMMSATSALSALSPKNSEFLNKICIQLQKEKEGGWGGRERNKMEVLKQ